MLLILTHWLTKYISAFRVFDYISFRALSSCLISLIVTIMIGEKVIAWLMRLKVGQTVRDDGPQTHLAKTGTPTMGGVLIIVSIVITVLLFADLTNPYIWLLLFVLVATGAIGFIDDYRKIVYKNPKGLSGRLKLIFQTLITIVVVVVLLYMIKMPKQEPMIAPQKTTSS